MNSLRTVLALFLLISTAGPAASTLARHPHPALRPAHHNRKLRRCTSRLSPSQDLVGTDALDAVNATPSAPSTPSAPPTDNTYPYTPTSPYHLAASTGPTTQPQTASISDVDPSSLSTVLSSALTPNGIKAGVAGGDSYNLLRDHIGWWYDWSANPVKPGKPIAVPMLWGSGRVNAQDAKRLAQFQRLSFTSTSSSHPKYVLGYEEPDCKSGSGSSGMSVEQGVKEWEALIAPLKKRGTKVGSPSMCKQADETWLKEFAKKISMPWDFTAIHVNKNNLAGVKKDIDHYWMAYGKPIWVTEFACVNDHNTFQPCTDQHEINTFIHQVVDYFESDRRVYAYAFSNGEGLGHVWPMVHDGKFSESGKVYLAAISKYH